MSGRAYQPLEYEAYIAPIAKPLEVIDAKHGPIFELFGSAAFLRAQRNPEAVPVVWQHRNKRIKVGHLVRVEPGTAWLKARFWLYDQLNAIQAAERLDVDAPVSIEFTPVQTLHRLGLLDVHWHVEARLNAVAVGIDTALIPGARIAAIHRRPQPARTTRAADPDPYTHHWAAVPPVERERMRKKGTLVRNFGATVRIK